MSHLNNLENDMKELCTDCHYVGTEKCNSRMCNIGFAKYVVENIKDKIAYPGNVLMYLMNVYKQKPEFAEAIKREYMS